MVSHTRRERHHVSDVVLLVGGVEQVSHRPVGIDTNVFTSMGLVLRGNQSGLGEFIVI